MLDNAQKEKLIKAAIDVRQRAYTPYSGYKVGAALLTQDSTIITGCNVENVAYGPTICAERTALVKAVSEGHQGFVAVAVVTENAGSPCGVCRQVLYEFSRDLAIILADTSGNIRSETTLSDLLPDGFGPSSLPHEPKV